MGVAPAVLGEHDGPEFGEAFGRVFEKRMLRSGIVSARMLTLSSSARSSVPRVVCAGWSDQACDAATSSALGPGEHHGSEAA